MSNQGGDDRGENPRFVDGHRTQLLSAPPDARPATEPTVPAPDSGGERFVGATSEYEVGAEVARGGLGRVLVAFEKRLGREVALKQLIAHDAGADARFFREARITARLQHPSIVPIYEAGWLPNGKPFYAMKLISGRTLRDVIAEKRTLAERLTLLPNVLAVAEAIAYAHDKQVIHRDIKPANVVLGSFGETMVIDWGLAKDLADTTAEPTDGVYRSDGRSDVTMPGAVVGTPSFMPPEQARGETVDARADVYALGALLYNVLAGKPPYEGASSAEMLERVLSTPPEPLERRVRGVPPDLASMLNRAMARDPTQRYPNGAAFAADLQRYMRGQLVSAHQYSLVGRLARFVERNKLPVALSAAFVVALTVFGAIAVARVVRARHLAEKERDIARARSNEMILAGARATLSSDPTATLAWLKRYPLDGTGWDEARSLALDGLAAGVSKHVFLPKQGPNFGAFSPDGRWFAQVMDEPYRVEIRDVESGRVLRSRTIDFAQRVRFSRDGKRVVWRDPRSAAFVTWDLDDDALHQVPSGEGDDEALYDVRGDGLAALIATPEGEVRFLDLRSGSTRALGKLPGRVQQVSFSGDGRTALAATRSGAVEAWTLADGTTRKWQVAGDVFALEVARRAPVALVYGQLLHVLDLTTGKRVTLTGDKQYSTIAALSADGTLLAASGPDRSIRVFDWQKGAVRTLDGHQRDVNALAFDARGARLASASRDETARVWDLASGFPLVLRGHGSQVVSVEFSVDGKYLATSSADRSTRIWALPDDFEAAAHVHNGEGWDVLFVDDTHTITVGREDDTATVADLRTGAVHNVAEIKAPMRIDVAPDGATYAFGSGSEGKIALWRRGEASSRMLTIDSKDASDVTFSCDGRSLASGTSDGKLALVDVATGAMKVLASDVTKSGFVAWSPRCTVLAVDGSDGHTPLAFDVQRQTVRRLGTHKANLHCLVFADERQLVTGDWGGGFQVADVSSGVARTLLDESSAIEDVAASHDGKWVASADADGGVRLWDTRTWQSRSLVGHQKAVYSARFSDDSKWLLTGAADRTVRLWDVATGAQLDSILVADTVVRAAFSPDRKRIAAVDNLGMVRSFRIFLRAPATRDPRAVRDWLLATTTVPPREDR